MSIPVRSSIRLSRTAQRIAVMYLLLLGANVAAWLWAIEAFRAYPTLLGTALLAYGLGLRHAVDADHIAAIDNVTRSLMQEGQRPVGVGLFFSLGHSTVVVLATVAIAATASAFQERLADVHRVGGLVGTSVSAFFLIVIGFANLYIFTSVYRTFQRVRRGARYEATDATLLLAGGGIVTRIVRPLFRMIRRSWHMYPLGFLFGLGFDTATEIGLLGIAAAEGAAGMSIWSILVFPALFTAGMSLVDATDSVLMIGAYNWAFTRPVRKLYYNLTITFASVVTALLIGGIELLGLAADRLSLHGPFWRAVDALNTSFGALGIAIVFLFVLCWGASALVYRIKRFDRLDTIDVDGPSGSARLSAPATPSW